jgi:RimJ/RimL family protein N-acetyltransferase
MAETIKDDHSGAGLSIPSSSLWVGRKVRLRGYEPEDWEVLARLDEHSADQRRGWKIWPPRSDFAQRKGAEEAAAAKFDGDALEFRLVIARREDAVLVGGVSVHNVDQANGTFMFGIAVAPEHKGNGYAGEAILLMMRYMLDERRFQKCESGVFDYNTASLALHRKLGFVEEGRLRRHVFSGGRYHDDVRFGMTAEEFHERYPELAPVL